MENNKPNDLDQISELDSKPSSVDIITGSKENAKILDQANKHKKNEVRDSITRNFNVYKITFYVILVIAIILLYWGYTYSRPRLKKENTSLTEEELKKLATTNYSVGNNQSTLNFESNSIFNGAVLFKQNVDFAGEINFGSEAKFNALNVTGAGTFDVLNTNTINVNKNINFNGRFDLSNGINVNGSSSFTGGLSANSVSTSTLTLNGDLKLNRHIDTSGNAPSVASGSLGAGGVATISGNDTAGTLSINAGAGAAAGVLATVTFNQPFTASPKVIITPVGSNAGNLEWYVENRSATGFQIKSNNAPTTGSMSFDFIAIE